MPRGSRLTAFTTILPLVFLFESEREQNQIHFIDKRGCAGRESSRAHVPGQERQAGNDNRNHFLGWITRSEQRVDRQSYFIRRY